MPKCGRSGIPFAGEHAVDHPVHQFAVEIRHLPERAFLAESKPLGHGAAAGIVRNAANLHAIQPEPPERITPHTPRLRTDLNTDLFPRDEFAR